MGRLRFPPWDTSFRVALRTASLIALYAITGPLWTWITVGFIAIWYLFKNVRRYHDVMVWRQEDIRQFDPVELFLSMRLFYRSLVLLLTGIAMIIPGITTLIMAPGFGIQGSWNRQIASIFLILAYLGLMLHAKFVHDDHHRAVQIETTERLRRQRAERQAQRERKDT